jgi:recombination protein RecA
VAAGKKETLEQVISAIQERWGTHVIGRSAIRPRHTIAHIPTGFPELDRLLDIGGIPRGRISEFMGVPTSGMATVALKVLANAQALGDTAVYIDLERTFDADYARRCGVALAQLTLVHPYDAVQALAMLPDFFGDGSIDLLLFDMPVRWQEDPRLSRKLSSALGRLLASLSRNAGTLLFLTTLAEAQGTAVTYPRQASLPHFATLRLLLHKEQWLYKQRDVMGYEAQVFVVKNKLAAPGGQARLTITFDEAAENDP